MYCVKPLFLSRFIRFIIKKVQNSEISSKKHVAIGLILLGGLLFTAGVLAFGFFFSVQIVAGKNKPESPRWTEKTGEGISAPACSSGTAYSDCSGFEINPYVDITWAYGGQHGTASFAEIYINGVGTWSNEPVNGSKRINGLAPSTSYTGGVRWYYDPPNTLTCAYGPSCIGCLPLDGCRRKDFTCYCEGWYDADPYIIDPDADEPTPVTFTFTTPSLCSTCWGVDRGFRANDGNGVFTIAMDPVGVWTSALHARRYGRSSSIKLSVLWDPKISKFRVRTNTGTYGICKL